MQRTQRLRLLALSALAGAALWLPGCDNPACIYGGNCFGGASNEVLGSVPATVPLNNEWLDAVAPKVQRSSPSGSATVDSRTPMVVVFSESMASSGMATLFLLQNANGGVVATVTSLIGDGRVLVLLPANSLTAGDTYTLNYNANAHVQDRNGQELTIPTDLALLTFTVSATNSNTPKLVTTWPVEGFTFCGGKNEVLAFFDRPLDPTTLDSDSFHVLVNGAALANPVEPTNLVLAGGLATDARVVRWRNVDAAGQPLALGLNAAVTLDMSPAGHVLTDSAGHAVVHTSVIYHTAPFAAPVLAEISADPTDAIGIDSISGPQTLAVHVTLEGTQSGDHLGLFLFGTDPIVTQNPTLICLSRDVALTAPFTDFTMTAQEINLLATAAPFRARFADGSVHFAFQVRRGQNASPITLLDTDATTSGEQPAVLDTHPPTLLGLSASGTITASFLSNMRDLVVVGRASEALRAASVTTAFGDNSGGGSNPPPVVGSNGSQFICRPVLLGQIDPAELPMPFQITIYDRALNKAGPLSSTFQQIGCVGAGNASFTTIHVRVFDAYTLAPIAGAHVHTHELTNIGVFSVADFDTDNAGFLAIPSSQDSAARNILTVDASDQGYELFTLDGVSNDRIDIPLHPLLQDGATVEGTVTSSAPQVSIYTNLVADSRLDDPGKIFEPVTPCTYDTGAQLFACPYDPYPILSRQFGAQGAFAVFIPPSVLLYTAAVFLKAATFEIPVAAAAPGAAIVDDQAHRHLLDDPTLDPEEAAIDAPPQLLTTTNYPSLASEPVVSMETTSPGMQGTAVVGVGHAFTDAMPPGSYIIRAAYPGDVDGIQDTPDDLLGTYVVQGTLDGDLRLRMQVMDIDGNIGGARPRLSSNPVAADPPAASTLGVFPMEPDALGLANLMNFTDVLPDSAGEPGLYRVTLTDALGGRWVIWTSDPPDVNGPEVQVRLPLIGPGSTFPMAPGDLDCRISLFAWPALDPAVFLWTDVDREYDLFSHSAPLIVTPP